VPDTATLKCGGSTADGGCNGSPSYYFRGSTWGLYVQDDWRLASRFSLNLGVRWDYQTPINELRDQIVNMAFAPNFTAYNTVQPGQVDPFTGLVQSGALIHSDKNNISPRIGLAWRPSAKHSTVIRSGYGISYNSGAYSSMATQLSQQPPLARSLNMTILNNLTALQAGTLTMANALTPQLSVNTLTKNTASIDPNYKIGYAQTWQLSVQQNLPYSFQSTFSYTGIKGTHLDRTIQPWVLAPGSTASIYPTGYTYHTFGNNSISNAASAQLTRRFSSGISASANYQFQKYIGEATQLLNWLDARQDRSAQNGPHSLRIQASYSIGQGRFGGGLVQGFKGKLLRDWTITSNISVTSGNPLTPSCRTTACQAVGSTGLYSRPMYTGVSLAPQQAGYYFNPSAFTTPAAGVWGNAGIGVIPGPMGYSLNGGASRVIRLGDRRSADFQVQANNVLNTVIINSYNTQVGGNTYGQASGTSGMRRVTASLRFRF
jgi:trimeric autotransporter adhesin